MISYLLSPIALVCFCFTIVYWPRRPRRGHPAHTVAHTQLAEERKARSDGFEPMLCTHVNTRTNTAVACTCVRAEARRHFRATARSRGVTAARRIAARMHSRALTHVVEEWAVLRSDGVNSRQDMKDDTCNNSYRLQHQCPSCTRPTTSIVAWHGMVCRAEPCRASANIWRPFQLSSAYVDEHACACAFLDTVVPARERGA